MHERIRALAEQTGLSYLYEYTDDGSHATMWNYALRLQCRYWMKD